MKITTIGLDLAKSVFHVVCFDEKHRETSKRMLRRNQMREYFAQLEPCRVAMEACAGAPGEADPAAVCEALCEVQQERLQRCPRDCRGGTRPGMRFVGIKTVVE
jgi:hypothetical protein